MPGNKKRSKSAKSKSKSPRKKSVGKQKKENPMVELTERLEKSEGMIIDLLARVDALEKNKIGGNKDLEDKSDMNQ